MAMMTLQTITVQKVKGGERSGAYEHFDLPDGAIIVGGVSSSSDDGPFLVHVAVPAERPAHPGITRGTAPSQARE